MTSNSRDGFVIPMPRPGDGTRLIALPDGSLSCSWDRPPGPRMALDAALNIPDEDGGDDLADKIHQLLGGKLDEADISALLELIQGPGPQAPPLQPAQDPGRFAQDRRMPSQATMRRLVQEGVQASGRDQHRKLIERFPILKTARVV